MRQLLLLLTLLAGISSKTVAKEPSDSLKLLFIGNSLTYTNDLPSLVKEIGKLDSKTVTVTSIALPDYSLEDHWNEGQAAAAIEEGKYDYVILQQGPSALPESQALLLTSAGKFAKACKEAGSKMAFFMVWPSKARSFDFINVAASYSNAAMATNAILCPAGLAWENTWALNKAVPLYGPDGFHPGMDGSVVAAMVIYGTITGKKSLDFLVYEKCSWTGKIRKDVHNTLLKAATASLMD